MDFVKDVTTSFKLAWKNKKVAIPMLLMELAMILVIFSFLMSSGLMEPTSQLLSLAKDYQTERDQYLDGNFNLTSPEDLEALPTEYGDSSTARERKVDLFLAYATSKRFDFSKFSDAPNLRTVMLILIHVSVLFLIMIYLTNLAFSASSNCAKGKGVSYREVFPLSHNTLFKLIGVYFILMLIYLLPTILFIIIAPVIGSILVMLGIFGIVFFYGFIMLRLYFSYVPIYTEGKGPMESIKKSWDMTKKKGLRTFGVMVAFLAISNGASAFFAQPMSEALISLILTSNLLLQILILSFAVLALILYAFTYSVATIYLFVAYKNFDKAK